MKKWNPNKHTKNLWNFSPGVHRAGVGELPDGFFSKQLCDTCGDTLAGQRYYCTAARGKARKTKDGMKVDLEPERVTLEICEACYGYRFE